MSVSLYPNSQNNAYYRPSYVFMYLECPFLASYYCRMGVFIFFKNKTTIVGYKNIFKISIYTHKVLIADWLFERIVFLMLLCCLDDVDTHGFFLVFFVYMFVWIKWYGGYTPTKMCTVFSLLSIPSSHYIFFQIYVSTHDEELHFSNGIGNLYLSQKF